MKELCICGRHHRRVVSIAAEQRRQTYGRGAGARYRDRRNRTSTTGGCGRRRHHHITHLRAAARICAVIALLHLLSAHRCPRLPSRQALRTSAGRRDARCAHARTGIKAENILNTEKKKHSSARRLSAKGALRQRTNWPPALHTKTRRARALASFCASDGGHQRLRRRAHAAALLQPAHARDTHGYAHLRTLHFTGGAAKASLTYQQRHILPTDMFPVRYLGLRRSLSYGRCHLLLYLRGARSTNAAERGRRGADDALFLTLNNTLPLPTCVTARMQYRGFRNVSISAGDSMPHCTALLCA